MRTIIVILFVGLLPFPASAGVLLNRFYVGGGRSEFRAAEQDMYPGDASGDQFSLTLGSPLRSHIDARAVATYRDLESSTGSKAPVSNPIRFISLEVETKLDLLRQDSRSNLYAFFGIGYNRIWWRNGAREHLDDSSHSPIQSGHIATDEDRFSHTFGVGAEVRIVRTFGIFIEWRRTDIYPLREGIRLQTITIGLFV